MVLIVSSVVVVAYLALCAVLFATQRSFIYFPTKPVPGRRLPGITLSVDGADLRITTRVHAGVNAVIYFGGNGEDVSDSLPTLEAAFPDHALYLMNYRGYGESSGTPSETALVADSLILFDKVHGEHDSVVVIGRSLGSGIAIHLASCRPVARLVLVTPYNSIEELAARQFPYLPITLLLRDKFESWRYAGAISAPTLVIAAELDDVIPLNSTESLFSRLNPAIASIAVVREAGHNSVSQHPDYVRLLSGAK